MSDDSDSGAIDWRRAQDIFRQASALPETERAAFVRAQCNGDIRLAEAVNELLRAAAETGDAIQQIVGRAAASIADAQPSASPPTQLGPYRILASLGAGGMGKVLLAERADEQFRQRVAIKVLGTPFASKELVRRFRTERQILANLNHPNIASLLDGGETDDGLPYLVMEYVDGQPILDYCRNEGLGLRQKLNLFIDVCEAIQHAHQNLVVHRDIKSNNIFVTADGQPKLLDFGIAKLLEGEGFNYTIAVTQASSRLLTPANASPEQISGGAITVATDVYQLGVLLYELLAGRPPYALDTLSPGELESAIREAEPTKPSDTTTDRLRRTLAGDLDTIVLKALRKNPARRYASARELAEDLRRYLDHEPVRARPDGGFYRIGKFLRRNTLSTVAATTIAALLLAFGTVTYFQNQRIAAERDTANAVSEFMVNIFEIARPEESPGETVTARQVLDSGYARIGTELSDQPDVRARLLWVMGESYTSLGLHDDALKLMIESSDLGLQGYLPDDDLVDVLANTAQEASYLDRYDEATYYIDQAEVVYARLESPDPTLGKILYKHHAGHLRRTGNMEAGFEKLLIAEKIAREITDDPDGHYPDMLHELGAWNLMRGNYVEAEAWLRRALAHPHPSWRDPTNRRAVTLGVLGSTLRAQGRQPEALENMHEALAILTKEVGPEHINVGITHNNIAIAYTLLDDLAAAETHSLRAVEIATAALGEEHSRLGSHYGVLATVRERQGLYDEALQLLERSLAIKRKTMAGSHPSVALTQQKLGAVHRALGNLDESLANLVPALATQIAARGEDNPAVAAVYTELGLTHMAAKNYEAAADALSNSVAIYSGDGPSIGLMRAYRGLADLSLLQNDCPAALDYAGKAAAALADETPADEREAVAIDRIRNECEEASA